MTAYLIESQESSGIARNEDIVEHKPFLGIEMEDTSKSLLIMRHENITEARRNGQIVRSRGEFFAIVF